MTKADKKAANRTLAAALRAEGVSPSNRALWEDAKDLVSQGLPPRAAARLVRSTLPAPEQVKALARKRIASGDKRTLTPEEVAKGLLHQRPQVTSDTPEVKVHHAPVSQAPKRTLKRTPQRAKDVKAGRVMRDAKGRLLSREAQRQREIEEAISLREALATLSEING